MPGIKNIGLICATTAVLLVQLISGCTQPKPFVSVEVPDNPVFVPNSKFTSFETFPSARFDSLKEKYQLDTIFHGEQDEFRRILLIRHWIHTTIPIDNYGPYPGNGSVESIIEEARKGHGFHCGHYMAVMNAILNGYGYFTRCILADVGFPVDLIAGEGHHALNEVWMNTKQKWVLIDAKYDYHFEKNGSPLSALEVRDAYLENNAADIVIVQGPNRLRKDVFPELKNRTVPLFARIYTWLSWARYGDRFTHWPSSNTDYLVMYADQYFKSHTWLYNGKPHWAYNTPFMILTSDRKSIEWTPNTIYSSVTIHNDSARIALHSITPYFAGYEMRSETADSSWSKTDSVISLQLAGDSNVFAFHAINVAGVAGPLHRIVIARQTSKQ